ncbi:MAG: hypothetical protein WC707_00525 [Candidatus Babeliaceae bacterium]
MIKKILFFTACMLLALAYFYSHASKQAIDSEAVMHNIMAYPMTDIIARCKKDHKYTDEDMIILEKELKRYLSLSGVKTKGDVGMGMYSKHVDNLWHTFILFTHEYAEFCNKYFGHFIHHMPKTDMQKSPEKVQEARADFQAFVKNYQKVFKEEIHPIWLLDMCEDI